LDPEFRDAIQLKWRAEDDKLYDLDKIPQDQRGHCWIALKQRLEPGPSRTVSYRIRHAGSNSIVMNSWEHEQRSRLDARLKGRDYECIWRYVAYPADRLCLRLVLPLNLSEVRPEFRCRRAPSYPVFPLTFLPNIAMEAIKSGTKPADFDNFVADED